MTGEGRWIYFVVSTFALAGLSAATGNVALAIAAIVTAALAVNS